MRPTVIRLIVGGALGIAFSMSLMLPGALVLPEAHPIGHLATPDAPSTTVVRAAPVAAPKRAPAPAPRRVVGRRVYVPTVRTPPAASVVRHAPSRSSPSAKPVTRTSRPAQQRLTPQAAPPVERERARKSKKAKKTKKAKERGSEKKDKGGGGERERKHGNDEGDDDEGGDRGDDSLGG
jgi:hypothetical protein